MGQRCDSFVTSLRNRDWLKPFLSKQIYVLQDNSYVQQPGSSYFPNLELPKLIDSVRKTATEQGTGAAMQSLRQQLDQGNLTH